MASQLEELGKALKDVAPDIAAAYCSADQHLAEVATEILTIALGSKASVNELADRISEEEIKMLVVNANTFFKKYLDTNCDKDFTNTSKFEKAIQGNTKTMACIILTSFTVIFLLFLIDKIQIYSFSISFGNSFSTNGPLGLLLGALISAFTTVVQYFFGSSASGSRKDDMLWKSSPPK